MSELIKEAGWGIWPVLAFGGVALGLALHHACSPRRSVLQLVVGFALATGLAGCLGTFTGVQRSAEFVQRAHSGSPLLFLLGLKESLSCVVAAFVLVTVVCLLTTVGSYRLVRREEQGSAGG